MKKHTEIFTMKEAAEKLGIEPQKIRTYETEFQIKIPRNELNRRYFTYKEMKVLNTIIALEEQGLTKEEILQSLKAPKGKLVAHKEVAATQMDLEATTSQEPGEVWLREALQALRMEVMESIKALDCRQEIEALRAQIEELKTQLNSQEKDVLLCENAKLKMKVKEKSYEVADLKDQLKRMHHQKNGVLAKMFAKKSTAN